MKKDLLLVVGALGIIALIAVFGAAMLLVGPQSQKPLVSSPQGLPRTPPMAAVNPTVSNRQGDLSATNHGDFVALWWERDESPSEYVLFRAYSGNGSWVKLFKVPLSNAVDFTPEARDRELCYRVEALDAQNVMIRSYESVCVPKFVNR